jgi:fusarinine C synthase
MCSSSSVNTLVSNELDSGKPKGVEIPHSAMSSYIASRQGTACEISQGRRLNFPSPAFDMTGADIFGTLAHGGCLCLASQARMQVELGQVMQSSLVTSVFLTPSIGKIFLPGLLEAAPSFLQVMFTGGERVTSENARAIVKLCDLQPIYGIFVLQLFYIVN